jgi:hypothetical protein
MDLPAMRARRHPRSEGSHTMTPGRMGRKVTCGPSGGKVTWLRVPDIAPSARKHGIADDDMRHALRNPLGVADLDDGLTMFIGPARDGTLVEVGVADTGSGPVIVHAMRARPKFLPRKGDH